MFQLKSFPISNFIHLNVEVQELSIRFIKTKPFRLIQLHPSQIVQPYGEAHSVPAHWRAVCVCCPVCFRSRIPLRVTGKGGVQAPRSCDLWLFHPLPPTMIVLSQPQPCIDCCNGRPEGPGLGRRCRPKRPARSQRHRTTTPAGVCAPHATMLHFGFA